MVCSMISARAAKLVISRAMSYDARNHPPAIDDRHRPAQGGVVRPRRINAHLLEQGAKDILHADRDGGWRGSAAIGSADDLAGTDAAAGEDHALGHGPVSAAGL